MIKGIRKFIIQNDSFIITPLPLKNELFSSWFVRTSYAHHTHPHTFFNLYFGLKNRFLFKKNIDTTINKEQLDIFNKKCSNKIDVNKLTMKIYSGHLQEDEITNASNRLFSFLKFCPKCLQQNSIPYFKQEWKLSFSTICAKHNCFLYDACPKCKSELDITKMYKDKFTYIHCHQCGFNFKNSKSNIIPKKYFYGIDAHERIHKLLNNGYVKFQNNIVYSFCFFDVITQLAKLILYRKNIDFINKHPLYSLIKSLENKILHPSIPIYSQLNIKEGFALFGLIMYLFDDYPNNFINYMLKNKLTHWSMMKDIRYSSFWYTSLVNNIIPQYIPFGNIVTSEEIEHGKKYLVSQKLEVNKANLSRLFGNINHISKIKLL